MEALKIISDTLDELIAKCKKLVGGTRADGMRAGAGQGGATVAGVQVL